ncbi:DNA-binding response regulator, NarL/FixJ family, contains REC and HTH domains [Amycolatopsis xylanica]|uniref:DNA-binding response regulator, NarL/FixJ family, contains REC and HTH domains n=1 Tax=Amycolatopsis xylanica TaxID=589385 RepID=A0A1H2U383_9PSEU|nr:response regulator transcription factor [Amycolatopsis xylanica]SDW50541.1 DNA-binding response regulator, NarL/FixJ family, contains REC and HTH domains [Amycolatopsis xylanica]
MRVLVVDHHPVTRDGVGLCLTSAGIARSIEGASDADEALPLLEEFRPDVVSLGQHRALGFIRHVRDRHPGVRVLVLAHAPLAEIVPAIRAGAHGYVSKATTGAALAGAVTQVLHGPVVPAELAALIAGEFGQSEYRPWLTARERDVLSCLAKAYDNQEIAAELGIAVRTVNRHLETIRDKLGTRRRSHLMRFARTGHASWPPLAGSAR